jgi:RHS repeat-associated protein
MRRAIRSFPIEALALLLALLVRDPAPAVADEVCGNGLDDEPDGLIDEGCNPEGYLGVRESPLPRGAVGVVAPVSGQEVWSEPADFQIDVPYGPDLTFTRSYNSQVNEAGLTFAPMGPGWRHNYMSWLQLDEFGIGNYVRARLPSGDEVRFTFLNKVAGISTYTPQAGHRIGNLAHDDATLLWTLSLHDGSKYIYSGSGTLFYLTSIEDARGYALTLSYTSGRLTTVSAATGAKELRFTYRLPAPSRLEHVEYWADGVKRADLELIYPFGPTGPTSAKLGGTTFRNYDYLDPNFNYLLTKVLDASGHTVTEFSYGSTAGKTVRARSGDGVVGYKYGATCSGGGSGVYHYFNLKDDGGAGEGIACDTDSHCGSGYFCGGHTTPGTNMTGLCFRARRCVTTEAASEDLVKAVGAPECTTCVDVAERAWDTSAFTLKGQKDADNVWTSYVYNSNGYVTAMVENDDNQFADEDAPYPPNPPDARTTWFFYGNPSFPSLVTEVRRQSEIGSGTCDDLITTGCKRTITTYTTGAQVDTIQEIGFTYNQSGSVIGYNFTTDYDYDAQGRVTQVNGPRTSTSYDVIQYTYWSGAGNLQNGHLKEVKRQKNATDFITTTYDSYDYWGNAGKITDPNANLSCLTFDANRNVLTTRRIAMANQTSCTPDASDLVTTTTYDSALNVTQIQHPEGNCTKYGYDTRGRLTSMKASDNCSAVGTDDQVFTFDDNGNLIKTEYKDSSGVVTKRQEKTFAADGRVKEILNPANTAKKKIFAYKPDGMLESMTGEDAVGKTEWAYDDFNRSDVEKRYKTALTFDTWHLTPGVQLDLPKKVQDDDMKSIDWVWDDMGRKVKQMTPDAGTTILVYDEAGNLSARLDGKGTADEKIHHFGFDPMNRPTNQNWGDPPCFTLGDSEIRQYYDDQIGCPAGTCVNSMGRLAKVVAKVRCDDAQPDDTFDQWTYYGYDDAGRLVQESIRDDGGRVADQYYTYDKNGNLTKTTAPSGYYQESIFGSAGHNADKDKLVQLERGNGGTDTVLTDSGKWYPFGPIKEYRQSNTIGGNKIMARYTWDLAHRPSNTLYERETSGTDVFRIAYTLDAQGRITVRDFTGGHSALQDAYYTYDWQNRITCDSAASGACPTTAANLKSNLNSSPPYTASSDRKSIKHRNTTAWPTDTFTYTLAAGKDQIASITKGNSQVISFGWDTRGNRLYDDDAEFADDRRDYVYDARDNLISVSGKMKISDTVIHNYTVSNAYDQRNRRVFKSILDTTPNPDVEAQYFYYYDPQNRLIEIKYTPNITDSSTYQIWQLYWLASRPVAIFQTSYPGATVVRRFLHSDHLDTPLEMYSWPNSGDAARAWAYNPDAFGWGDNIAFPTNFQPLRFPGQVCDEETTSVYFDTATSTYKSLRPPLSDNRYRVYDPFAASYLQADPLVDQSRNSYDYADSDPVSVSDPDGLLAVGGGFGGGGDGGPLGTCWECKRVAWPLCGVWCSAVDQGGWRGPCKTIADPRPGRGHCFACRGAEMTPCDDPISIGGGGGFIMAIDTSTSDPTMGEIATAVQGPAKRDNAPRPPRVKCQSGVSRDSVQSEPVLLSR